MTTRTWWTPDRRSNFWWKFSTLPFGQWQIRFYGLWECWEHDNPRNPREENVCVIWWASWLNLNCWSSCFLSSVKFQRDRDLISIINQPNIIWCRVSIGDWFNLSIFMCMWMNSLSFSPPLLLLVKRSWLL